MDSFDSCKGGGTLYSYDRLKCFDDKYEGRPFYLLKSNVFRDNYLKLDRAFKSVYPNFQIAYSYKTNYTSKFCQIINDLGGYAEVVSDMELHWARRIGVDFKHIIYNGPLKGNLQFDLLENEGVVIIDNVVQLEKVTEWAHKNPAKTGNIALRLNFDLIEEKISRFGFDIYSEEFVNIIDEISKITNLKIKGIHCHFSGARSVDAWKKRVLKLAEVAKTKLPYLPEFIDLGSGMYGEMNDELAIQFNADIPTFDEYAIAIGGIMRDEFSFLPDEKKPMLIVEPGTTLVANAMQFVSKVLYIKNIRGKDFIGTNGSIHNVGELCTKKSLPITVIHSTNKKNTYKNASIVGYTCLEYDIMHSSFNGDISKDDFIIFDNVGSYSVVLKPPFIFPQCAVLESIGDIILGDEIKRPESFDDIFKTFLL